MRLLGPHDQLCSFVRHGYVELAHDHLDHRMLLRKGHVAHTMLSPPWGTTGLARRRAKRQVGGSISSGSKLEAFFRLAG